VKASKGIFYGDYAYKRNSWSTCHQEWRGRYYKAVSDLKLRIAQPLNDQGVVFKRKEDDNRFLVGRD